MVVTTEEISSREDLIGRTEEAVIGTNVTTSRERVATDRETTAMSSSMATEEEARMMTESTEEVIG